MKTTKKDWIYRVILLILLAIIWDIGAALTSPIFVPQKGGVIKFDKKKPTASDKPATNVTTNASTGDDTINLSLDEWAG